MISRAMKNVYIWLGLFSIIAQICFASEYVTIVDKAKGASIAHIRSIQAGRYHYVSAAELADALSIRHVIDMRKKQIQLEVVNAKIVLTALSPFIQINSDLQQIPINVLYRSGTFYVPLEFFIDILSAIPFPVEYDGEHLEIFVGNRYQNLVKVEIYDLENGTLIRIHCQTLFNRSNIFTSDSNDWFYIDFYGGKIDTSGRFAIIDKSDFIRDVVPIQLSRETSRLSFRYRGYIKERQVFVDEKKKQVIVSLRTREDISDSLLYELEKEREKWKIDTVVIDPGHGGKDPGAIGSAGTYEKHIVLEIAKALKRQLQKRLDAKIYLTRETDRFIPLRQRTRFANERGGKLFISIHADANRVRRVNGFTVYFMGPAKTEQARKVARFENSVIRFEASQDQYKSLSDLGFILGANAQNAYNRESQDLAAMIEQEISQHCDIKSHGVRQAGFYVLYGASMPNVLIESGYISNYSDEKKLRDKHFQKNLARAICDGILNFKHRYESF